MVGIWELIKEEKREEKSRYRKERTEEKRNQDSPRTINFGCRFTNELILQGKVSESLIVLGSFTHVPSMSDAVWIYPKKIGFWMFLNVVLDFSRSWTWVEI